MVRFTLKTLLTLIIVFTSLIYVNSINAQSPHCGNTGPIYYTNPNQGDPANSAYFSAPGAIRNPGPFQVDWTDQPSNFYRVEFDRGYGETGNLQYFSPCDNNFRGPIPPQTAPANTYPDWCSDWTSSDKLFDLQPGSKYRIAVYNKDVCGNYYQPPNYLYVQTPTPYFHQYKPVECSGGAANTVLNWDLDPAANNYRVIALPQGGQPVGWWWTNGANTFTFNSSTPNGEIIGPGGTLIPNPNPAFVPGTNYSFIIVAVAGSGNFWYSDSTSAYPNGQWSHEMHGWSSTDCTPPGAFNITAITPSCPAFNAPGQVKLDWSTSTGATTYQVYYDDLSTPGIAAYSPAVIPPTITQTLTGAPPNTGLIPNTPYGFVVGALKGAFVTYSDNGTWSQNVNGGAPVRV